MKVQSHMRKRKRRKRRNILFQLRLHLCWTFSLLTVPSTANQTQQRLFHPRRLHNQQERAIWRCLCYTDRKESYSFRKNTIHSKSSIWNTRWQRSVKCSALSSWENMLCKCRCSQLDCGKYECICFCAPHILLRSYDIFRPVDDKVGTSYLSWCPLDMSKRN